MWVGCEVEVLLWQRLDLGGGGIVAEAGFGWGQDRARDLAARRAPPNPRGETRLKPPAPNGPIRSQHSQARWRAHRPRHLSQERQGHKHGRGSRVTLAGNVCVIFVLICFLLLLLCCLVCQVCLFITSVLLLSLSGYLGAPPGGDASAFPFPNDTHPQSKLHEERVGGVSKAVL